MKIQDYHIHVYYLKETLGLAREVAQGLSDAFELKLGRFHEGEVGPHPMWSVQLIVPNKKIGPALGWLSLHRQGLTIFVHPNTGDGLLDHTDHAIWLGGMPALNLGMFKKEAL